MSRRSLQGLLLSLSLAASHSALAGMSTAGQLNVSPSGGASYSIPIQVPPGTAGIAPQLSLSYSSQSGNGLLGVGWSLSGLSSINRCPQTMAQDSVRGAVNYDNNDRYCLDGQRLIVISGAYGADSSEYRTERDSYTKIIAYGTAGNGPAWFKAWTKAGQIIEFGNTADSRIEAQGKSTVRSWALNKLQDSKSNYLTVTYTEDSVNGDAYPQRIDYSGNGTTAIAPNNSVQFSYQARPDITPLYQAGSLIKNSVRLTNVKTYNGTMLVKDYRLAYEQSAATQNSRALTITECAGDGTCLPAVALTYQGAVPYFSPRVYTDQPLDFTGYQLITGDFNGDGKMDLMYIAPSIHSARSVLFSNGDGTFQPRVYTDQPFDFTGYQLITGDFNGDGKTDLLYIAPGLNSARSVFLSNGDGTFQPRVVTAQPFDFAGYQLITGDFNGDGKMDLMYIAPSLHSGRSVFFGNGDGTFQPRVYTDQPLDFTGYQLITGDFNGDGKTDLMYIAPGIHSARSVILSNGDGTFQPRVYTDQPFDFTGYQLITGDFNGDGKMDLMYIAPSLHSGRSVFLSNGDGTFQPRVYTDQPLDFTGYQLITGDFNGDGKMDLMYIASGIHSARSVILGNGDGTFQPRIYTDQPFDFSGYDLITGDFNGDGKLDLLYIAPSLHSARSVFLTTPTNIAPDLLTAINSGLGASTSLVYKPVTDPTVYTKDSGADASVYPTIDLQIPLYVVSSAVSSNGIGGSVTSNYSYGGLKADANGRGLLGFRWTDSTQAETGLITHTEFRQDWPYTGLVSSTKKTLPGSGNAGLLSQIVNSYNCINPVDGSSCVIGIGKRYYPYTGQSVESDWDLNGAAFPIATTAQQIDNYGNPTQINVSSSDGFSKATTNSYLNDTVNWYLGRLTRSSVTSTSP